MHNNKLYNAKENSICWEFLLNIPEFKKLSETPQNSLWHKEGNAYIHTCKVAQGMLDYIAKSGDLRCTDYDYREILVLSALLHDIGKPLTTVLGEDGLYHCKNHAIEGACVAEKILDRYVPGFQNEYRRAVVSLVRWHMHPLYILKSKDPKKSILRLANNLDCIDFDSLLLLKKCDCEGSVSEMDDNHKEILEDVKNLYYETCSYPSGTNVWILKLKDSDSCIYSPGHHPNGINSGYLTQGCLAMPVSIGFRTCIGLGFSTSPVTKIIDKNHFETKNSVYKITTEFLFGSKS